MVSSLVIALSLANSPVAAQLPEIEAEPLPAPVLVFAASDAGMQLIEGQPAENPASGADQQATDAQPLEFPEQDNPDQAVDPDGGDLIIVEGQRGPPPGDPLIRLNEGAFKATMAVDSALVEPIADTYRDDVPGFLRRMLASFFRNLKEPVVALNYVLQLKPGKAAETLGRFAINSTIGVAGLVDVAALDPFNLPYRNNGLANTLGYYGVGPGPFLILPLVGATTLRDVLGSTVDNLMVPAIVGHPLDTPYYAIPAYTVNSLESRIEYDEAFEEISESASPYDNMRIMYLERREREINELRGRVQNDYGDWVRPEELLEEQQAEEAGEAVPQGN